MRHAAEPPTQGRQLGRSRLYTQADLPQRLRQWHAPRANRWEYLCIEAGELHVQWLGADGACVEVLGAGGRRWIAPGMRWRIARLDAQTRFRLEIHADDATAASAPQHLRAALLDEAEVVQVDDETAFARLVAALAPGERILFRGGFDFAAALHAAMDEGGGTLCWHPLDAASGGLTALVARSAQAIGMLEYLGRDHAVIEAALAGALRGDAERATWLRHALARHLAIEEEMLFPAYRQAGGNPGWVRGLCNEHEHLRHDLERLAEPASQRRFLLLLDGHDEKEEQIVYPDILARVGSEANLLTRRIMALGAVSP